MYTGIQCQAISVRGCQYYRILTVIIENSATFSICLSNIIIHTQAAAAAKLRGSYLTGIEIECPCLVVSDFGIAIYHVLG